MNIYTDKGREDDIYLGELADTQEIKVNKDRFWKLRAENKAKFFKEYCLLYVDISRKGKITRQTAAYMMANSGLNADRPHLNHSFHKDIDDVIQLALHLELPYRHATAAGNKKAYDEAWENLVRKINHLK